MRLNLLNTQIKIMSQIRISTVFFFGKSVSHKWIENIILTEVKPQRRYLPAVNKHLPRRRNIKEPHKPSSPALY